MTTNSIPVAPVLTTAQRNYAGQVKVNFNTALTVSGAWTASNDNGVTNVKQFDINAVISGATISSSPTTTWPFPNSQTPTINNVFDPARGTAPTGRLIENPAPGQIHVFRVEYSYTLKAPTTADTLFLVLRNPVSGFRNRIAIPAKTATGSGYVELTTIADPASILSPNGYVLEAYSDTNWTACTLQIVSITRISQSIENA